jgi:hypothetical protein
MTVESARERVQRAAYAWRYALVTPGADLGAAESELVEAVDELDVEQAYERDAAPAVFELCDHPRLVPRLPCAACAPRYERRANELRAKHGWKAAGRHGPA